MIKVEREETPAILACKKTVWTRKLMEAGTHKEKSLAESKYRHPDIKNSLLRMFHGKCAYCESKMTHVDYGHIEHYRPKAAFPELTFEWSNLLLACGICNGAAHKGKRFPDIAENGPVINPCEDEPSDHFTFVFDLHAKLATVIGKTGRGKTTENLLGLNRHELRAYRSKQVQKVYVLSELAVSNSEAQSVLNEAIQNNAEYAAFARALLSRA